MSSLALFADRAFLPRGEVHDAAIVIQDDLIASAGPRREVNVPHDAKRMQFAGGTIVPGFVDLHVHGAGGHDVMEATPEALSAIATALACGGTTSFVATTVTSAPDVLCGSAAGIAGYARLQARPAAGSPPRAEILGVHFEGPFISRERRGVHPEQWIAAPSLPLFALMCAAAAGTTRILTLAPEAPGAIELIDAARKAEIVVSMGHTDATYEQAMVAVDHGASHAAHVFNAMRPFSHRDSGVLGAVLTCEHVTAELIADGIHVEPVAMQLLLKAKPNGGVVLVSDGTAATGMPDGGYRLGDFDVQVKGGVVRNTDGKLAGSALTLDRALRNMVELGVPLDEAIRMLTVYPARVLGIENRKGALAPGSDADLVVFDEKLNILRTVTKGAGLN